MAGTQPGGGFFPGEERTRSRASLGPGYLDHSAHSTPHSSVGGWGVFVCLFAYVTGGKSGGCFGICLLYITRLEYAGGVVYTTSRMRTFRMILLYTVICTWYAAGNERAIYHSEIHMVHEPRL